MNPKTAIKTMLYPWVVALLFHLCIMLKMVSYKIAWGGGLKNNFEMYIFETISVIINLFLITILLIKGRCLKAFISMKIVNITLWVFFILFGLNTIGNILAKTNFEKIFTLLTLAFSILILIILRQEKKRKHKTVRN